MKTPLLALVACLSLLGCGNTVVDPGGGAGGAGLGCPAAAPAAGSACAGSLSCSYGTPECTHVATCVEGAWDWDDGACYSPCPVALPSGGEPCSSPGQTCSYQDQACSEAGADAVCAQGHWEVTYHGPACAPVCPANLPPTGAPCNPCCDGPCEYVAGPGCPPVAAICDANGHWSSPTDVCTTPPPCEALGDEDTCATTPDCRWLVPGCSMPALPYAGCYPSLVCDDDSQCGSGKTCLKCEVNPCPDGKCNACSSTTFVCVYPPPP